MADQQWIIDLKLENEQAKKKAEELGERLDDIEDEPLEVDADTEKAEEGVKRVGERSDETKGIVNDLVREFERMTGIDLGPLGDAIAAIPGKLLAVVAVIGTIIAAVQQWQKRQERINQRIDETADAWANVFKEVTAADAAQRFVEEFTDELRQLNSEGISVEQVFRAMTGEQINFAGASAEALDIITGLSRGYDEATAEAIFMGQAQQALADDFEAAGYAGEEAGETIKSSQSQVQDEIDKSLRKIRQIGGTFDEEVTEAETALDRLKGSLNVQLEAERFQQTLNTAFNKVREGERLTREETIQLAQDFVDLAETQDDIPDEVVTNIVSNILSQTTNYQSFLQMLRDADGLTTQQIVEIVYRTRGPSTYVPPAYPGTGGGGNTPRSAPINVNTQVTGSQLERTLNNWNRVNGPR